MKARPLPGSGGTALHLAARVERYADELPEAFRQEVVAYLNEGERPSQYVRAIVANDLAAARPVYAPVDAPKDAVWQILNFLLAHAPHESFGSYGHLRSWVEAGGVHGRRAA